MFRKCLALLLLPLVVCLPGGCPAEPVEGEVNEQAIASADEETAVQTSVEPAVDNGIPLAGPITGTWSGTLQYTVISTVRSDDPAYPVDSSPREQQQVVPWTIVFDASGVPTAGLAVLGGYLTSFPSSTPLQPGQVATVLQRRIETGTLQSETATVYEVVLGPAGMHVVFDLREWSEGGEYRFEYVGRQASDIAVSGDTLVCTSTCIFNGWVRALDGHVERWEWTQELSGILTRQ